MIYNIYFNHRQICITDQDKGNDQKSEVEFMICKNTKSFDKVYNEFIINPEIDIINILSPNPDTLFSHLKKKYKTIKAAGGTVINKKGELLIIKRNGIWDLPKGKIEPGETKKQAAIREVQEECGIDDLKIISKIAKTYHTYHFKDQDILKTTHWYKMSYIGNKLPIPQTEEGISEIRWITNREIDQILENTYNNLIKVFEIIQNNRAKEI